MKTNHLVDRKEHCYGCTVCFHVCPRGAIKQCRDEEGFFYPQIEESKCIDCGLCISICPFHTTGRTAFGSQDFPQRYYAAQHKDHSVLSHSTSGGMFTALSDYILSQDGIVYGAAFQENLYVRHSRAKYSAERNTFCGVKYIQSDMIGILRDILTDLGDGKMVLFTGTPCQAAGVKNYIQKQRGNLDNLYLCDFICHGAASPKIWEDYVCLLKQRHGDDIQNYQFRSKTNGWRKSAPEFQTNGSAIKDTAKNSFFLLYRTCYINRPSCYVCQFTSYDRCSDITIGDFWNIDKTISEPDNDLGTSEVLTNSEKGEWLFRQCLNSLSWKECRKEDVWQPHLEYPEASPGKRTAFWTLYYKDGLQASLAKYGSRNFIRTCKIVLAPIAKKLGLYVIMGKLYRILVAGRTKKHHHKNS